MDGQAESAHPGHRGKLCPAQAGQPILRPGRLPIRSVAMKIARAPKEVMLLPMSGIIVIGGIISYMSVLANFASFSPLALPHPAPPVERTDQEKEEDAGGSQGEGLLEGLCPPFIDDG